MKKTQPTHTVYNMSSLYDGVVKEAERYGDKARYIYIDKATKEEKTITYNEMLERVNSIAAAETAFGFAGEPVVITGESNPYYVVTYLSTVACGGISVPLDKDISVEAFCGFTEMCEAKVIVYTASLHKKILEAEKMLPNIKYFICIEYSGDDFPEDPRFIRFEDFLEAGRKAHDDGVRTA